MADRIALPGWPAVLHEEWAAAYLSLSTSTFRAQVAPQVPPVHLTARRIGWLRVDLDNWLARRQGVEESLPPNNPWNKLLEEEGKDNA